MSQLSFIKIVKKIISEKAGLTQDEFISRSQEVHKDENGNPLYDYSLVDFVNTNVKVKVLCKNKDHREQLLKDTGKEYFEVFPNKHLQGSGVCPYDSKRKLRKYSDQDLENEALKYTNTKQFKDFSPLMYYSAVKNKDFYDKITSHFTSSDEYSGEKFLSSLLVKMNLISDNCINNPKCQERQKTFTGCLSNKCKKLKFDFFIPSMNTCIEYDGEQHFRPANLFGIEKHQSQLVNDKIKNAYCRDNGIKLIRISYKIPFNKIEEKLSEAINSNNKIIFIGDYSHFS